MAWSFGLASYIYSQAALIALTVAFFAWRRRNTPGAWPLAGMLAAGGLWAITESLENAAPTLETMILMAKISHIGIQAIPVFFLLFVLRHSGNSIESICARERCLWIVPALAVFAAFSNDAHHLFWRNVELVQSPFGPESVYIHGPIFWISVLYLYFLLLTGTILLVWRMVLYQDIYRQQAGVLVAATIAPWLANLVYLSGLNPIPGFDWTPLAFIVSGVLLAWGIFRIGLLDLRPIARSVLFDQMKDALLVIDAHGYVVDANPAAYQFFSGNGSLIGHKIGELLTIDGVRAQAPNSNEIVVILGKNGAVRQLDVRVTHLSSDHGRLDGRLITFRDTTDRMHMEESLRKSEQRYRTLVDNAPFPCIVCTVADGALRYANLRARDLLGVTPDTFDSVLLPDLFYARADGKQALTLMQALIQSPVGVTDYAVQLRSLSGRAFHALLSAVTITYEGEEAILTSVNDITVRRQAEQALIDARVEAESALRAKSEFLATVSHELRTPLSSIIGLSEALRGGTYGSLNANQRRSLETIIQNSEQLAKLVKEVLDLSRLEAGAVKLEREQTLIDEICQSALYAVRALREPGAPPPAYTIQPTTLTMMVDPRRLHQILLHLLSNAAKFTSPDRCIGLEVMAVPAEGVAHFVVWDEGIGISAEQRDQLFRPFAQLDSGLARRYAGMGLGLAIVRHLVELHGGQVTVVSEPGEGSRFAVTLPLEPPQT